MSAALIVILYSYENVLVGQMAFVPEYGDFVANSIHQTNELAEPIDGAIVSRYRELARQHSIWLSLGGFHIKARSRRRQRSPTS